MSKNTPTAPAVAAVPGERRRCRADAQPLAVSTKVALWPPNPNEFDSAARDPI